MPKCRFSSQLGSVMKSHELGRDVKGPSGQATPHIQKYSKMRKKKMHLAASGWHQSSQAKSG
ncbi:hypothetical protein RvY_14367 [Ramazzottius varieornatus]|uniref:Uncharacterized protein n=1 Tax=Ramazzottius varieornatus TaxID=947166 RepID=A0A1D1VR40_RAMVA|nr:hypothetical protein RvY_14367 [Ramazzottius varieornatus]